MLLSMLSDCAIPNFQQHNNNYVYDCVTTYTDSIISKTVDSTSELKRPDVNKYHVAIASTSTTVTENALSRTLCYAPNDANVSRYDRRYCEAIAEQLLQLADEFAADIFETQSRRRFHRNFLTGTKSVVLSTGVSALKYGATLFSLWKRVLSHCLCANLF